jgi:hypothetical protein
MIHTSAGFYRHHQTPTRVLSKLKRADISVQPSQFQHDEQLTSLLFSTLGSPLHMASVRNSVPSSSRLVEALVG